VADFAIDYVKKYRSRTEFKGYLVAAASYLELKK
jgi:hypothetical protein